MKRVFVFLAAAMLIIGVAGNGMAAMEYGTFYSLVNDGTSELVGVLDGDAYDGLSSNTVKDYFNQDLSYFANASTFTELTFGGFAGNATGTMLENYDVWVTVDDVANVGAIGPNGAVTVSSIQNIYPNTQGDGDVQELLLTQYGLTGGLKDEAAIFTGTDLRGANVAASLEAFDSWTTGDVVTVSMDILHYASTDWAVSWTMEDTGLDLFVSRIEDGSIQVGVSAVPIPGAAILLGSGLLSLVGLRVRSRRQ